jgi:CRISPR-associated endonuclease/helicase Cas3
MNDNQLTSIKIQLEPRSIASCDQIPAELAFMRKKALQHQVDVFEKSRQADIILDLAPTGTGKTQAGLSVILHQSQQNAIYLAPTNALVEQQRVAAEKFVQKSGLPHLVKSASAKEIKTWPEGLVGKRSGEKLYNVLRNPATVFDDIKANQPILLVTNPDIFYYATFFGYNKLDQMNIASSFLNSFGTVIIDEFHLYDAKQLVSLIFYLTFSKIFRFFENGRKIVLLTATPEPACEIALDNLQTQGVKIVRVNGDTNINNNNANNLLPSQTAVNLELRPAPDQEEWLKELGEEIFEKWQKFPDQNGAVILDSLDVINRLSDLLQQKGLTDVVGRITGPAPKLDRQRAMQCPIILATSTVDVGFNFEKEPEPIRQNLDWLIFSCRDQAAFWQRLGRVGRVLGKSETNIPSEAIAYLPSNAWLEGLSTLDINGGYKSLKETLGQLSCLEKPFLRAYWRSEAFLEIARPLLEIEKTLENLPSKVLVDQLFTAMQEILGGKHNWDYYRYRMRILLGANEIAKTSLKDLKKQWKYLKGGQAFMKKFLEVAHPEDFEDLQAGRITIEKVENFLHEDLELAKELQNFAKIWVASYDPLFQFRYSLFESIAIYDPKGLLLDVATETFIDPIHLLRNYEFLYDGNVLEITSRAKVKYELSFSLRHHGDQQDFVYQQLNKLTAFAGCQIQRKQAGAIAPTPFLQELEKHLLSGVIICPIKNATVLYQLKKQRIIAYLITVKCDDYEKEYCFLPGLNGILAMAMKSQQLRLPDDEPFII